MTDNTHGQVPNKYLTVVYRDIAPGQEARELIEHPKMSASSWSHALNDRDAAIAQVSTLRTAHVQNHAEIEHVAGDVSKNGAELNVSTQQPAPATQKLKEQMCISDINQSAACAVGSVGTRSDAQATRSTREAESVLEDAARWQWLADYLIGERTDLDEGIVACATIDALRQFADAARKQGANHE